MGWSTIMYVAALSGVSMELHEAAKIDGASRFRRILLVDLPAIMPTIAIMLIMRFGSIMSVGYEKAYLMQTPMNLEHSEIISTYLFTYGLQKANMSYGSAIGIMNSVINSALVITVNKISNWLTDGDAGLF
jgi:putative aldouronate transport system permease protein